MCIGILYWFSMKDLPTNCFLKYLYIYWNIDKCNNSVEFKLLKNDFYDKNIHFKE